MAAVFGGSEVGETDPHGDADHPGAEFAAAFPGVEVGDDFDKGILCQIGRALAGGWVIWSANHADAHGHQSMLVLLDQFRPSIASGGRAQAALGMGGLDDRD